MDATSETAPVDRLVGIMARLRSEQGCPWDREQTLESLKPYCLEEAYEVLEAIDGGDPREHCEELGDLLLQVVFQAQLRREEGAFDFDDVATAIADKLVRRHPHVFGDVEADTPEAVLQNWDAIKQREKGERPRSLLAGIPKAMPALQQAQEMQKRAARVGFDWGERPPVLAKIREELAEVEAATDADELHEELGDLLFSVVNLCRHHGVQAEQALRDGNHKFRSRFGYLEDRARAEATDLQSVGLERMEAWWQESKSGQL